MLPQGHSQAHPPSFPPPSVIPAKAGIQGWARVGHSCSQQPTRQPTQTTEKYRKLPEITGSNDFSDTKDPFEESTNPPATHRHSRESGNPGMGRARGISTPQQPTRQTTQTTEKYRKLPEITGSGDFSNTTDPFEESTNPPASHRHSRESGNPGMGQGGAFLLPIANPLTIRTTEKYRKLPEITGSSDFPPLSQYKIEQVTK